MIVEHEGMHSRGDTDDTRIDEILAALQQIPPRAKFQKTALFSKLYPDIKRLLHSNISQKAILSVLEKYGLKLHPARFKELLAAEDQATRKAAE